MTCSVAFKSDKKQDFAARGVSNMVTVIGIPSSKSCDGSVIAYVVGRLPKAAA